jgi:hypothetical protein
MAQILLNNINDDNWQKEDDYYIQLYTAWKEASGDDAYMRDRGGG